jgi:DeoR/GlpR family transcriptional regulator of sugar metabolism
MTVKCLTLTEKHFIAEQYDQRKMTQKELSEAFLVSERTINRVLIEKGLATPITRIKGDAYLVMQLLKKHNLDLAKLTRILEERELERSVAV